MLLKLSPLVLFLPLIGCVVAPAGPYRQGYGGGYVTPYPQYQTAPVYIRPVPPPYGVIYQAPRYPVPGGGYNWRYHPDLGYGWHHEEHGWRH